MALSLLVEGSSAVERVVGIHRDTVWCGWSATAAPSLSPSLWPPLYNASNRAGGRAG